VSQGNPAHPSGVSCPHLDPLQATRLSITGPQWAKLAALGFQALNVSLPWAQDPGGTFHSTSPLKISLFAMSTRSQATASLSSSR
jgi:hypothetical protein